MGLLSQEVTNLFSGVSKQPHSQRRSSHLNEQLNALVYQGRVLGKRPGSTHVAHLTTDTTGDPFVFSLTRSVSEKYVAVILNGDIKVYNWFTGDEMTVDAPEGLDYLTSATEGFRAETIGDRTLVTNRSTVVRKGTSVSPAGGETALVVVKQGNFGTFYSVTLAFSSTSTGVNYRAPQSSVADAEEDIGTEAIAAELYALLDAETDFDGVFTFALHGSTIAITPVTPGLEFTVITTDGLGDEGMRPIKGAVPRFADLPLQAPDGTLLEVTGSEVSAFDNYWVRFDAAVGVWKEAVAPECLVDFDVTTMPHLLEYKGKYLEGAVHDGIESSTAFSDASLALAVNSLVGKRCNNLTDGSQGTVLSNTATTITTTTLGGGGRNTFRRGDKVEVVGYGIYFTFRPGPWEERTVGDTETNPYPSFVGKTIRDVGVMQGKLVLVSEQSVVLSKTTKLFQLFRSTVTQVLPDDPLDFTETLPSSSKFHAFTEWDGRAIVWSDLAQYEIKGEPVLTPDTVSFKRIAHYQNLATCRPVASGSRVFFVGISSGLTRIMEFSISGEEQRLAAQCLTDDIPAYIEGSPVQLEADDTNGTLLVFTRVEQETRLYALSYYVESGKRVQHAWGRWDIGDVQPELNYSASHEGGDSLGDSFIYLLTEDGFLLSDEEDDPLIME